jgi:hypothetical protein
VGVDNGRVSDERDTETTADPAVPEAADPAGGA